MVSNRCKMAVKEELKKLELPPEAYRSVDFSLYTNADGFYSINQIDYLSISKTWKEITIKPTGTVDPNKEKEDNEAENLKDVIKSNFKEWKNNRQVQKIVSKLQQDPEIQEFLNLPPDQQKGKWRKLVASKLTDEELRHLRSISRQMVNK